MAQAGIAPEQAYALLARGNAPDGMRVEGVLDYSRNAERPLPAAFPEGLSVDLLDLSESAIEQLPIGLSAYELRLARTALASVPADVRVEARLDLTGCARLERLPGGLTTGALTLRGCTALRSLPEGLDVWFLDLTGCWAFERWPEIAHIRSGHLQLRGCTALTSLPPYLRRLASLNVRDCPNLRRLPDGLEVSGWLDVGHSGLQEESALPPSLDAVALRWAGVRVDRRVAFHPETIQVAEVLEERNAERRRVLLDRYGYKRFLEDSQAEVLDGDVDPGGPRQLVRVEFPNDEALVALACFCPSTGRQYMIRVPPNVDTCHRAAAWIAGFDNPEDYQPVLET